MKKIINLRKGDLLDTRTTRFEGHSTGNINLSPFCSTKSVKKIITEELVSLFYTYNYKNKSSAGNHRFSSISAAVPI